MDPPADLADRLAERTLALCRIDSVYGHEGPLADHVEGWARGRFPAGQVRRVGNALVAGDLAAAGRPVVALVGHLDTVPGHEDDAPPRREGDRVHGLGASDMKGGLAVAMALAEDLDLAALPVTLWLIFYDKEEGPHEDSGLGPLMAAVPELSRIDLALVMEPTDDVVQVGCVGSVHATITFRGRRAHAARPWHGENAITKAGRLLASLHTRPPKEVRVGGHVFREVMTVTTCAGGRYRNVVPDRMVMNLNYRFAPGRTVDEARADVEALVAGEADVEYVDLAPSGQVPAGSPLYEKLLAVTGLSVAPKQAWTDVARLAEAGIDAVNLGPGLTAQAHQADEHCEASRLAECYRALRRFLEAP